MDCPPITQLFPQFLLRSKTIQQSAHIAQALWDFPPSSKPEEVVRLVCTHCKVQITQLQSGLC